MPRIVTVRSKDEARRNVISLVLSQDAVTVSPNGEPWCGVTLTPEQARSLAERLCSFALEIDNGEELGYRTSSLLLTHLDSVVVVHDGSLQGHRAFEAARLFPSTSRAQIRRGLILVKRPLAKP